MSKIMGPMKKMIRKVTGTRSPSTIGGGAPGGGESVGASAPVSAVATPRKKRFGRDRAIADNLGG